MGGRGRGGAVRCGEEEGCVEVGVRGCCLALYPPGVRTSNSKAAQHGEHASAATFVGTLS